MKSIKRKPKRIDILGDLEETIRRIIREELAVMSADGKARIEDFRAKIKTKARLQSERSDE